MTHKVVVIGCHAAAGDDDDDVEDAGTVTEDLGAHSDALRTDGETVDREARAIKLDGLSVAELKELQASAEKHAFAAEVDRMMKLIINSLYRNKEIFLRELISNASDALDKIRFLSLLDKSALSATEELSIKIKADKDGRMLHVTDTGIGMTKVELEKNLGTIAKSGTVEFFEKLQDKETQAAATNDLIGQFGVGFYSTFLVADTVIVTSKHNDDKQYIWTSNGEQFSIAEDPRGPTLKRGSTVTLVMKDEAREYLEQNQLKQLVQKYSQFINFPIYLWESKTETVEEPVDTPADKEEADDEASVTEEDDEKDKPKTKKVEKTTWDWVLANDTKPIWLRNAKDIEDKEYDEFYKSFTKDSQVPLAKSHFNAEGEVSFKSILFVPATAPSDLYTNYAKRLDQIKLYVRRVFITDDFEDLLPRYLSFLRGVVDSDDLPLNVSRETLQQHKLLKVIKKKLVRKALDMFKKIEGDGYKKFWEQYGTSIKLGLMEDAPNKARLSQLLRFHSSHHASELCSLEEYVGRMKEKQDHIYFMASSSRSEAEKSPFVERLLTKGYEVLYFVDPVDEYTIQTLPEFEGKKFQNVAKEGLEFADEAESAKEKLKELQETYQPLTDWLKDQALSDVVEKAVVSNRLVDSPCALVASQYGWSGNMERIMRAQAYAAGKDSNTDFYMKQKKTLEINPGHPLIKELLRRVQNEKAVDQTTKDLARVMYESALLRSGFALQDSTGFATRIERMLRLSLGVDVDAPVSKEFGSDEGDDEDGEEEVPDLPDDTVQAKPVSEDDTHQKEEL
eukprot:Em0001g263a